MLTVEKFLFCLKLETGGSAVGWMRIFSSLVLGISFIASIAFAFEDCVDYINKRFAVQDESQLPIASQ
jgi:hypothetical protein